MEAKLKKERIKNIIATLTDIMENDACVNRLISDRDLKVIEALLRIKPCNEGSQED